MLVFLAAEPFRFWHRVLDDLARRIDPDLGGYDAEDYRRAAEIIDRLAAKPRVAGTDTEPQAQ